MTDDRLAHFNETRAKARAVIALIDAGAHHYIFDQGRRIDVTDTVRRRMDETLSIANAVIATLRRTGAGGER